MKKRRTISGMPRMSEICSIANQRNGVILDIRNNATKKPQKVPNANPINDRESV